MYFRYCASPNCVKSSNQMGLSPNQAPKKSRELFKKPTTISASISQQPPTEMRSCCWGFLKYKRPKVEDISCVAETKRISQVISYQPYHPKWKTKHINDSNVSARKSLHTYIIHDIFHEVSASLNHQYTMKGAWKLSQVELLGKSTQKTSPPPQ